MSTLPMVARYLRPGLTAFCGPSGIRTIQGKRAVENKLVAPQRLLCDPELRTHPMLALRQLRAPSSDWAR